MTLDLLGFGFIALVGIIFSALYSGLETGLYTINRVRLAVRSSQGDRRAIALRSLLDRPNRMLSTLLIGNNAANYAGSFGIAAILNAMGVSPVQAVAINAGILVPLLFVFGETLPKDLFRTHTDSWSYRFAGFLSGSASLFTWLGLTPIVRSFGVVSARLFGSDSTTPDTARQRISQLIAEGVGAGVLTESQNTLVDRALAMRDLTVADEMIPWKRIIWLRADADDAQRRALFRQHNFSRVPVLDANDRVLGVLEVHDVILSPDATTIDLIKPITTLQPNMRVVEALQHMQSTGCIMAVVCKSKQGRPIGLVTYKDLVEPLTGDLPVW